MEINKNYRIAVSSIRLFEAWVSEEMIIPPAVKIESNPTVGGHYKLYASNPPEEFVMVGEFKEVDWGKRLVYSWNWEGTDETTIVTVEFKDDEGSTELSLSHKGFQSRESLENHDSGWDSYVNGLEARLLN